MAINDIDSEVYVLVKSYGLKGQYSNIVVFDLHSKLKFIRRLPRVPSGIALLITEDG